MALGHVTQRILWTAVPYENVGEHSGEPGDEKHSGSLRNDHM